MARGIRRWWLAAAVTAALVTGCSTTVTTGGGTVGEVPSGAVTAAAEGGSAAAAAQVAATAAQVAASSQADFLWVVTSAGGRIDGVGADTGSETLTLVLTGVRDYATQFTDRPARQAYVLPTAQFAEKWDTWFADAAPNAVLSFVPPDGPTPRAVVLELTDPVYDAGQATLTFSARHLHRQPLAYPGAQAPTPPRVTPPATFASGSLFIDPATIGAQKVYGMGVSSWQKYRGADPDHPDNTDFTAVPEGYLDAYFATIAPYAQWVTNYGLQWADDMTLVRAAHKAGLKVAVTPQVEWTAAGASPNNATQLDNAVTLVNEGNADAVVIGNEVLSHLGGYSYDGWATDMKKYIADVKNRTGNKVPVGTSYDGKVFDDAGKLQEKDVNSACDFVQITVHPANWARDGGPADNPITDTTKAVNFLKTSYDQSRQQLNDWGLNGVELQIRETGWPSHSNFGNGRDSLFTPANAADYFQKVQDWVNTSGAKVYWFMAVDEPPKTKAVKDPSNGNFYYDLDNYEANWGIWHFTPNDRDAAFAGDGPWGTFTKKY